MNGYDLLADVLVVTHFAFVAFVVVGQALILLGLGCGWRWVRNPWFRSIHLACILVVAIEGMFDVECPLTVWERDLRVLAGHEAPEGWFIARLAHNILFYDAPHEYFERGHMIFGVVVLLTFLLAPPRFRARAQDDLAPSDALPSQAEDRSTNRAEHSSQAVRASP